MIDRRFLFIDAQMLAETIIARCTDPEDGRLGELLRMAPRHVARAAVRCPDVQFALAVRVSATEEAQHSWTAMLLRAVRQVDSDVAAAVAWECDRAALARTLSYAEEYTANQVNLLARLYACNPEVGRRVLQRCGSLFREFLARTAFPYLDLPEELVDDVEQFCDHA
ncbi:MAG TPA: hypothetical protein GX715_09795 [Armatimonadetes bacterium]|nr:hypothetical protein [Armatimonadota bacterium]